MFSKRELVALVVVLVLVVAFPASLLAYQGWRTSDPAIKVITVYGNAPVKGGWQPDTIRVNLGDRVRLRVASNDVVHGLIVPELGIQLDEVQPGHVEEVEFVASKVGRFAFACSRWCSVDHWRMRGVIEVVDPANPASSQPTAAPPPAYQQLHVDIDALHPAGAIPPEAPSAAKGAALGLPLPATWDSTFMRAHSPAELFALLRGDPAYATLREMQRWDFVALAFQRLYSPEAIQRGQALFSRDCAACHGQTGRGDGPAGTKLPGRTVMYPEQKAGPADLHSTDMLGASDVLLEGKILRGGMGTGMPEWGSLYSEADRSDVIAFIRSLLFRFQ